MKTQGYRQGRMRMNKAWHILDTHHKILAEKSGININKHWHQEMIPVDYSQEVWLDDTITPLTYQDLKAVPATKSIKMDNHSQENTFQTTHYGENTTWF